MLWMIQAVEGASDSLPSQYLDAMELIYATIGQVFMAGWINLTRVWTQMR